jgi:hypothetical protein
MLPRYGELPRVHKAAYMEVDVDVLLSDDGFWTVTDRIVVVITVLTEC